MECLAILVYIFSGASIVSRTGFAATDSISVDGNIADGQTMVSAGGTFVLGFFSPGKGNDNRYVGIWYQKSKERVLWVANRENPLNDSSGVLKLTSEGVLTLLNRTDGVLWSSNVSKPAQNPTAQLLDSGNFVVKDGNDNSLIWQSFDHPCDSFLAGMKFGIDIEKGLDRYFTSWRSANDPSPGDFTYRLDPSGFPQLIVRNNSVVVFRSGPWNGLGFSAHPQMRTINTVFSSGFVFNQKEIYFYFENFNNSVPSMSFLNENGISQRFTWSNRTFGWILYSSTQTDECDNYALCGGNGNCNIASSPRCECLMGFVPKYESDWNIGDWSNGCVRRTELDCLGGGDKFLKYANVKLPDTRQSWFNMSMNLQECKEICFRNCSCTAYSNADVRGGGSGCFLWFGNLMDIKTFNENGQDLYVRLAASEIGNSASQNSKKSMKIIISCVLSAALLLSVAVLFVKYKRDGHICGFFRQSQREDLELPIFDFLTIVSATNNFSSDNKLGEGGFGAVYKGVLRNGQEIAVKRLAENSRQGLHEFKSEVMYIAKLQHRNLIKLLGCCIQMDEKMLIYEFMPNRSLDCFIFDQEKGTSLDWPKRFAIINGIALGLLYLHRDSRLRIIHRDLKAENILLDKEMNPKISDFGLARTFGGNESEANTRRVVGTYGYMSPEYAIHGFYSTKSDIFSFGVLVLEIVHGRRNRGYRHSDNNLSLLGHAWILFKESRPTELLHPSIADSCNHSEVLRLIHVALLCVQQSPKDRPEMSSVVMMLGGESTLPQPKQPGFFNDEVISEASSSSSSKHPIFSVNKVTISQVEPR